MKKFFLLNAFAITMMLTSNLIAATITVTTTDDETTTNGDCSLREAIYNANDNDDTYPDCDAGSSRSTDEIILDTGSYYLSEGELIFRYADDVIIEGEGADSTVIRGHFYVYESEITLNSLSIKHSSDEYGGAIIAAGATVTLNKCKIASNKATYSAGAIWAVNSDLTINNSTISENQAASSAGAILAQTSNIIINQSTISKNESEYDAGGIYLSESELILLNSTVSGNISSSQDGGGIYLDDSELSVSNSTITENTSENGYGGGIYHDSYSKVIIKSSILSGNTADKDDNCYGENITSEGYNFFESSTSTDCDITLQRTDIENSHTNLDLSSLDDNGGSTETHALGSSSMAIDEGSCDSIVDIDSDGTDDTVTKDQRGRMRTGSCDIGAYEKLSLKTSGYKFDFDSGIIKGWDGKLGDIFH